RRGYVAVAAALALLAGVLLVRMRSVPPQLELVALSGDGAFVPDVAIPADLADTLSVSPGAAARVPLVLAVRNVGGEAATPDRLELNLPNRYRLSGPNGRALPGRITPGNPLVRYEIDAAF